MLFLRTATVLALSVSLVFAPAVAAAPPAESGMKNVELSENGVVISRVVDLQGNPVAGQKVSILFGEKEVATAFSDADGFVAISGLRPGPHMITTELGATPCRFWSAGSAPPASVRVPAVVSDAEIVRAQLGGFNLPMLVYGAATFVALGLAIEAEDDADGANSKVRALQARVEALESAS